MWSRRYGNAGDERAFSVAAVGNGGLYIAGSFTETTDFGSGPRTSAGLGDIFVLKLRGR